MVVMSIKTSIMFISIVKGINIAFLKKTKALRQKSCQNTIEIFKVYLEILTI